MTVQELIDTLSEMPRDAPVKFVDPDTEWFMRPHVTLGSYHNSVQIDCEPGTVYIWSQYGEDQ